jgi:tRNA A37 threonylcarbamoyladenosine dehydratase
MIAANVPPALQRLALVTGAGGVERLARARVMVFGLGGVGSWAAEALARSGVGALTLVDSDAVCVTNINRQVEATTRTIGQFKATALATRLREIAPACNVTAVCRAFSAEERDTFAVSEATAVIDAIDSLENKLALIEYSTALNVPLYSSMGMAQKLDPLQIRVADIWQTNGCPLAKLVRTGLRKRGFEGHFPAVYSRERIPLCAVAAVSCGTAGCLCPHTDGAQEWCSTKRVINGSAVTVTATAGFVLASLVMGDAMRER